MTGERKLYVGIGELNELYRGIINCGVSEFDIQNNAIFIAVRQSSRSGSECVKFEFDAGSRE